MQSATNESLKATERVVVGVVGGAAAGGLSGAAVKIIDNIAKKGKINDEDIIEYLTSKKASYTDAASILHLLYQ